MKVATVLGTRPEIIRLSLIINHLDRLCEHILIDTGQNQTPELSLALYKELGLRDPDERLRVQGRLPGERIGSILAGVESVLLKHRPDRVLVMGDTDSSLSALAARRHGIEVYHLEAGYRCHDTRVPEENNRVIIDHISTYLLPYTDDAKQNLIREGVDESRIMVVGNPSIEILMRHRKRIDESAVLDGLGLEQGRYTVATLHRSENVDDRHRLADLLGQLSDLSCRLSVPVVFPVHPRTRDRMATWGLPFPTGLRPLDPLGFADFIRLVREARLVVTDSGTVQEEATILGIPLVTLRDSTERPETVECGANIVCGTGPGALLTAVDTWMKTSGAKGIPKDYGKTDTAWTVASLLAEAPQCLCEQPAERRVKP